jgi:dGTPase
LAARIRPKLTSRQALEFSNYEGNALGFRLVTHLLLPSNRGGLQLTYATLAASAKYPICAHKKWKKLKNKISAKKFNFFETEQRHFEQVATETGLIRRKNFSNWWCRHPLAFVSEAADDITYRMADLEDGFRMACVSPEATIEVLKKLVPKERHEALRTIALDKEKVGYLRAIAINELVQQALEVFFQNYSAIMEGQFEDSLLDHIPSAPLLDDVSRLMGDKIYTDQRVLSVEVAGFEIIYQLLDRFGGAAFEEFDRNRDKKSPTVQNKKILGLMPEPFQFNKGKLLGDPYQLLHSITDFVAGMTDSYAVSLYQKITGQKFVT